MAAARAVLEKCTMMLLTASKVSKTATFGLKPLISVNNKSVQLQIWSELQRVKARLSFDI